MLELFEPLTTSLETDAKAHAFKEIIDFAHSQSVKIGIQLAHAGRKSSTMHPGNVHKAPVKPSPGYQVPFAQCYAILAGHLAQQRLWA